MTSDTEREITVTLSVTTYRLLEQLAERGLYGIGVEGVVESFVYRGLQESYDVDDE